ncbi:MAG: PilZ domain-containing protein [Acidobacteria bacterium]|nr:PilZ domain-containing protein [Acidobacteriota bacterium]MBV9480690.1 PilZ domain-containing protein [Acidobacteriota bacterium]
MTDTPVQHERRSRQRFDFQIPVSLRVEGSDREEPAFTQDLSARGAFLHTDCVVDVGAAVELTLLMPSEITLAESMRVRCRGKVLRVARRDAIQNKIGLAIELLSYQYLPEKQAASQFSSDFERISLLHEHALAEDPPPSPLRRN